MALIDDKAFRENDQYVTAIASLDLILNSPELDRLPHDSSAQLFRERVPGAEELLDQPADAHGKAILIALLYLEQVTQAEKDRFHRDLNQHCRPLKKLISILSQQSFELTPSDARLVFELCLPHVIWLKLFAPCVHAAIAGSRGEGSADFLATMQQAANTDLIELLVVNRVRGETFDENVAAGCAALKAIGGDPKQHPAMVALREADAAVVDLTEQLADVAHPIVLQIMTADCAVDAERSPAAREFWNARAEDVKALDRTGRSQFIESVFLTADVLGRHPYFQTPIGADCDYLIGRASYRFRWEVLEKMAVEQSKRQLDVSEARAMWLLDCVDNDVITCPAHGKSRHGRSLCLGEIKFHQPSIALLRAMAAALPKGNTALETRVRQLSLKKKGKAILLEGVARVDPRDDLDGLRRHAAIELQSARQAFDAENPEAVASPSQSLGALLKDWFRPAKAASRQSPNRIEQVQRDREARRTQSTQDAAMRQLTVAVIMAQRSGLDVHADLEKLNDYFASVSAQVRERMPDIGPIETLEDIARIRKNGLDPFQSGSRLKVAQECLEVQHYLRTLTGLSDAQRAICERLSLALLPVPSGPQPPVSWLQLTEPFLGADVEEVVRLILSGIKPFDVSDDQRYGSVYQWPWSGLRQEVEFITALIWLASRLSAQMADPLQEIAQASSETLRGHGPRSSRFANAAMWALSDLPGGAGRQALQHLSQVIGYPSMRARALDLLKSTAVDDKDAVVLAETTAPDHGLAVGMRLVPLKLGAARLSYAAPADVDVSWAREDGKIGKVPTPAMKAADPDGIKGIKKLTDTIKADLATLSAWLETLYLVDRQLPFADWKARYLDHGTLGALSRNAIWMTETGQTFLPTFDEFIDASGANIAVGDTAITLWHPLHANVDDVRAWRTTLMDRGIVQPFPQAWRDTYTVKPGTNSVDLFKGHFLSQKDARALMTSWGWTGKMLSDKSPSGMYAYHLPETDIALVLDLKKSDGQGRRLDRNKTDSNLILGALHAVKLKLGASPTPTNVKNGKPAKLSDHAPIVLSELLRQVAIAVEKATIGTTRRSLYAWQEKTADADYSNAFRDDPSTVRFRRMCELLDAIIAHHDLKPLTREGKWLMIKGGLGTYRLDLVTDDIVDINNDEEVFLQIKPTQMVPATPLPHGRDDKLFHVLATAEKLADDVKLSQSGGRYRNPIYRRKRHLHD